MPQKEISIIRSLLDPAIPLDTVSFGDLDTGTSTASKDTKTEGQVKSIQVTKDLGTNYPYIEINNYVFSVEEIESFEITYTGFIPTVRLVAGVKGKVWGSEAIPKDGDLMNVFIRAKNDAFKPIRNDYRITSTSSKGANNEGRNAIYTITGELFIPHLYDPKIKAYTGTSYEALKTIAKELNLGFASNDTATNDSQTWINPGGDYYSLMIDIADHAWKDEKSFFDIFIDVYYHLNFINVNNQFSESNDLDLALLTNMQITDSVGGEQAAIDVKKNVAQVPKVLTNYPDLKGTAAYIFHYNVKNSSNTVNEEYGYKTYSQFFEQNSEKYWSIYTEPLTTTGSASNKIILKGRTVKPGAPKEEYYKTQVKYEWKGIQYTAPEGNVHEKYAYASGWNERNLAELEKILLDVELERGNFNLYRGERVPLFLMIAGDNQYQNIAMPPEQGEPNTSAHPQPILDKFYSGYYMVSGMTFSYSPQGKTNSGEYPNAEGRTAPGFTHKVQLTRREWPTPI
jgi:hypothetical protein